MQPAAEPRPDEPAAEPPEAAEPPQSASDAAEPRPDEPAAEPPEAAEPPQPASDAAEPQPDEPAADMQPGAPAAEPQPQPAAAGEDGPAAEDDDAGCLIATAAYGTELAPQVQRLREVRDGTLLTTESGAAFMSAFGAAYYAVSPHVADLERAHPALRQAVAAIAAPMLYALSVVGAAEPGSERDVVAYGALAIALVAGMYVAAPAAGAWYAVRLGRARGRNGRAGRAA